MIINLIKSPLLAGLFLFQFHIFLIDLQLSGGEHKKYCFCCALRWNFQRPSNLFYGRSFCPAGAAVEQVNDLLPKGSPPHFPPEKYFIQYSVLSTKYQAFNIRRRVAQYLIPNTIYTILI